MTPSSEGYAVIFFNEQKKVKIRQQALGVNALDNYPYNWNFHVVFVWKKGKASRVYDFDSRLPWGVSFMEYYDRAVLTKRGEPPTMARAVPCRDYFDQFSSNRAGALEPFPGGWKYKYIPSTPNMIGLEKPLRNTIRYYYNSSNTDPFFGKLLKSKEDIKKFFMM